MKWFGEPWPSGVCDTGERVDTPLGHACIRCEKTIAENDQGVVIPSFEIDPEDSARLLLAEAIYHRDCMLEEILGPNWMKVL